MTCPEVTPVRVIGCPALSVTTVLIPPRGLLGVGSGLYEDTATVLLITWPAPLVVATTAPGTVALDVTVLPLPSVVVTGTIALTEGLARTALDCMVVPCPFSSVVDTSTGTTTALVSEEGGGDSPPPCVVVSPEPGEVVGESGGGLLGEVGLGDVVGVVGVGVGGCEVLGVVVGP